MAEARVRVSGVDGLVHSISQMTGFGAEGCLRIAVTPKPRLRSV